MYRIDGKLTFASVARGLTSIPEEPNEQQWSTNKGNGKAEDPAVITTEETLQKQQTDGNDQMKYKRFFQFKEPFSYFSDGPGTPAIHSVLRMALASSPLGSSISESFFADGDSNDNRVSLTSGADLPGHCSSPFELRDIFDKDTILRSPARDFLLTVNLLPSPNHDHGQGGKENVDLLQQQQNQDQQNVHSSFTQPPFQGLHPGQPLLPWPAPIQQSVQARHPVFQQQGQCGPPVFQQTMQYPPPVFPQSGQVRPPLPPQQFQSQNQLPILFKRLPTPAPPPRPYRRFPRPYYTYVRPKFVFYHHKRSVSQCVIHPELDCAISFSTDNRVLLWKHGNGRIYQDLTCHKAFVDSVGFTNNGRFVSTSDIQGTRILHEIFVHPMSGGRMHLKQALALTLTEDQPFEWIRWNDPVIVGKGNGVILVKNITVSGWNTKALCYGRGSPSVGSKFSGQCVFVAYADDCILCWNLYNGEIEFESLALQNRRGCASTYVVFSTFPDQFLIATNWKGGLIAIWNFMIGEVVSFISHQEGEHVSRLLWMTRNVIAVGMYSGKIFIYHIFKGDMLFILTGHRGPVTHIDYNQRLGLLISCSQDTNINIYQTLNLP